MYSTLPNKVYIYLSNLSIKALVLLVLPKTSVEIIIMSHTYISAFIKLNGLIGNEKNM